MPTYRIQVRITQTREIEVEAVEWREAAAKCESIVHAIAGPEAEYDLISGVIV